MARQRRSSRSSGSRRTQPALGREHAFAVAAHRACSRSGAEVRDRVDHPAQRHHHQRLHPPARARGGNTNASDLSQRCTTTRQRGDRLNPCNRLDDCRRGAVGIERTGAGQAVHAIRPARPQSIASCRPRCARVSSTRAGRRRRSAPGIGRRVVVGVVQQQHRALAGLRRHARRDRLRRGPRLPISARLTPQQRAPTVPARESQRRGVEHAIRGAVQADRATGGRLERVLRTGDVGAHLPRGQTQQVAVTIAVQADLVPGGEDLRGQAGRAAPARRP